MMTGSGDNSGQRNAQNAVQDGGQRKGQPPGQPPTGQAPRGRQESAVDKLKDPLVQDFAKGISALYTIVGVGLGLLVVALGFVGKPVVLYGFSADAAEEVSEFGAFYAQQFVNQAARTVIQILPIIAVAAAVLVGLYGVRSLAADKQTTFIAIGAGSFVGSFLMVFLGSYLAASQMESLQSLSEDVSQAVSQLDSPSESVQQASRYVGGVDAEIQVQTVDLVLNGIVVGVVAAIVAVATAYAYRNYLVNLL
jgi:hypothetical protein